MPIYGKLADIFGRKPVMLLGIGLFLLGSVLCGLAWCMPALIAFRAVQGLGAGAVQPMSMTIAGDIYTLAERAKVQGYLASVWAISAVVGPTLGGVFSEYLELALDLLRQHPAVPASPRGADRAHFTRAGRRDGAPHRLRRRRAADRRLHAADPRPARGRAGLGVGVAAVGIGVLGRRARARWSCSSLVERRAAEPVLPLWVFTPAGAASASSLCRCWRRRDPARPDLVRADLRPGRARRRAARRRVRAGHADHRLADRGVAVRAASTCGIGFRVTALIGGVARRGRHRCCVALLAVGSSVWRSSAVAASSIGARAWAWSPARP